tara:strand:- start:456 stop:602 length:147 start_codon:yes stop_codon:yes gene_type:complete
MNKCEMCDEEWDQKLFCDICRDCLDGEPSPLDELSAIIDEIFDKKLKK